MPEAARVERAPERVQLHIARIRGARIELTVMVGVPCVLYRNTLICHEWGRGGPGGGC